MLIREALVRGVPAKKHCTITATLLETWPDAPPHEESERGRQPWARSQRMFLPNRWRACPQCTCLQTGLLSDSLSSSCQAVPA